MVNYHKISHMSVTKEVRQDILSEGGWLVGHSLNQYTVHQIIEGERNFYGNNRKEKKAKIRAEVNERYKNEYPTTRCQFQRSLEAVLNGRATVGHMRYVFDHLDGFGTHLDDFITEAGSSVTIIRLEEPHY